MTIESGLEHLGSEGDAESSKAITEVSFQLLRLSVV